MTVRCVECETIVFKGKYVNCGCCELEIVGDLKEGAGQCDGCGKYFCTDCRAFDEGLCPDCQHGYIPF